MTVAGLIGVLLALGLTAGCCLGVLLPKTRFIYSSAHVRVWAGSPAQPTPEGTELPPPGEVPSKLGILQRSAHELGWIFLQFREVNNTKANRLENAYKAVALAIALVLIIAAGLGIYAGATEPPPE